MRRTKAFCALAITAVLFFAMPPRAYGQASQAKDPDATQEPNTNQEAPSTQSSPAPAPSPDQTPAPLPSKDPDAPGQPDKPSLLTPLAPQTEKPTYDPITARQRLRWFITDTIGPQHLAGGIITSAFGTALDRPKEYGPHWGGFADRFGMRLTGVVTSNAMEASIGAAWGEDPRYFRVPGRPFGERVRNVVKQTFIARQRDGSFAPAYARYTAFVGNNFLSNEWRVSSEANTHDALLRSGEAFAGRMAANAFEEFWPDVKARLFHHAK
jgi:hypothetical protein